MAISLPKNEIREERRRTLCKELMLNFIIRPFVFILIISILVFILCFSYSHIIECSESKQLPPSCDECRPPSCNGCSITLVESIPEGLIYPSPSVSFPSTYSVWDNLITNAESTIDVAVFYWTLRNEDVSPINFTSANLGEDIFNKLLDSGHKREIKIRIAQNAPTKTAHQTDSKILAKDANAKVVDLDFDSLLGGGVLHTKLWIVDKKHVYIGSANMDWRALTQVKELGILFTNCSCIAEDILKIFEVYFKVGEAGKIPEKWEPCYDAFFNMDHPATIKYDSAKYDVFATSSPLEFNPQKRTNDIDGILAIINSAKRFIYIAVMDYFPRSLYSKDIKFWPLIDSALRRAALEMRVEVRILASHWNHTRKDMVLWLKSLQDLSMKSYPMMSIETKLFVVPTFTPEQKEIPFARVNHNKYMVTDEVAYIGTSNWSKDYFTNTAGVGVCINETLTPHGSRGSSVRHQLQSLFLRDWHSVYAKPLQQFIN